MLSDPSVTILMYFVLPVSDWICHRATSIETASGVKESAISRADVGLGRMCAERRQSFEAAVGRIPVRRSAAGCRELSLPALLGIHAARLGCLLRRSCGGFGTDRARFRAGHSITLVQRDFTGDAALDWGYAGLRFSDRGALRFRVSGKYQGETHNKTQDQTHSDHSKTLCNDLRVHRATLRMCLTMRYLDV